MRTTKVKRLWPVLALAPLFALAAIFGVSLWHSGPTPTALTPPAAEAQGRDTANAATPTAGTCQVDVMGNADDGDARCITAEDTIDLVVFSSSGNVDDVAVYVTGATGTQRDVPGIQAVGPDVAATPAPRGKRGVGLYLYDQITAATPVRNALGAISGVDDDQIITVQRSWATGSGADAGNVWVYVYTLAANPTDVPTRTATGSLNDIGGSTLHDVVQVHFTQPLAENFDGTLDLGSNGTLPAKAVVARGAAADATPKPRRFAIASGSGTESFTVSTADETSSNGSPALGGQIQVAREFTPGSALKSGVSLTATGEKTPSQALDPSIHQAVTTDGSVTGWADEGAVELKVTVTHTSPDGNETVFDPFWYFRSGPPETIEFAGDRGTPTNPHRVTDAGTTYGTFGRLAVKDALGLDVADTDATHVIYEGANAAAVAILPTDEGDRMIPITMARRMEGFSIDIKDTATSATYDVNFVVKDDGGMNIATLSVDIEVIGMPDAMAGSLLETTVSPGQMLELRNVALNSGSDSAFESPCSMTASGSETPTVTASICNWTGKTETDRAVLTGGQGKVNTNGEQSIVVKADAAPGTYTIVLSDGRSGVSSPAADRELTFMVRGRPAMYTLDGPVVGGSASTRISAGQIGSFTVTATDANGNAPYFPNGEDAEDVFIVVSGDAGSVDLLRVTNGKVTLNSQGTATFQVLVKDNAASGNIRVTAVGLGTATASKSVAIGPVAPLVAGVPSGMSATASVTGSTAAVTLTWTPGANATRHWIAGIKQADWTAGDFSNVIWGEASSSSRHTVANLEVGQEYVFTVTAGNTTGWSAWAPLFRYTPRAPSTGGGGIVIPFN